uniref:Uncharacterized protein n=1 Tax=Sphaerodactylus townsendi TaxID=933632 RepID=A0ACB8F1Q3_9SAUR
MSLGACCFVMGGAPGLLADCLLPSPGPAGACLKGGRGGGAELRGVAQADAAAQPSSWCATAAHVQAYSPLPNPSAPLPQVASLDSGMWESEGLREVEAVPPGLSFRPSTPLRLPPRKVFTELLFIQTSGQGPPRGSLAHVHSCLELETSFWKRKLAWAECGIQYHFTNWQDCEGGGREHPQAWSSRGASSAGASGYYEAGLQSGGAPLTPLLVQALNSFPITLDKQLKPSTRRK